VDFVFDIDKTVAAAAYLTRLNGNQISIFLLLKMMYGAERRALATWHRPITGDSFCSMKRGPILTRTYDLIKGDVSRTNSDMVKWSKHFFPRVENEIKLRVKPNFEFLSELEIDALKQSAEQIERLIKKHGLIADALNAYWPEWKNPAKFGKGTIPLSLEDVLAEVLEDETEVQRVASEIRAVCSAKAALQVSGG